MHGKEGAERIKQLGNPHMRALPSRLGAAHGFDGSLTPLASSSQSFFCKDGRKISVGDCVLFKLTQDSLPSIGLVYRVTIIKDNNLKLGVNRFYRPSEVKLGKGILSEAAPNEIFYSFIKFEIPATSLLHPCKVAFLPKGAELPNGICSFVCHRVYDIAKRRLWLLTDKSHYNEEIDKLLHKTRVEMHASSQTNGRSPKQANSPMSTSQLKPGADSLQSAASSPSQSKGKKRERSDQSIDTIRREKSFKMGDSDAGHCSSESLLKSEIAKILEKGPVVDTEGVDRLVQVMFFEINERKFDFSTRTMLTSIIAATEKSDCLSRFVQIRGLTVLDDWLQDVHKGKTGDNDKVAEEFLLVLLRALDKLPVNLPALQMCNIGKSVNHLRTHKNLEIQKKARSLVDTWKKRVEAEMNMNESKTGSNQVLKSPTVQTSASKAAPTKGEASSKSASQLQGSMNLREGPARNGSSLSDAPLTTSRDEKSSSSSPSHNSSLSCSAVKEELRSSGTSSKVPSLASCNRKTVRTGSKHRNVAPDKACQSGLTSEKAADVVSEVNSHKFIVKIPSRSHSPAQRTGVGGSVEDSSSAIACTPSPGHLDRHDKLNLKEEIVDASQANANSRDEDDGPALSKSPSEEHSNNEEINKKTPALSKSSTWSPRNAMKVGRETEDSMSPMNALIQSCVNYVEDAKPPVPVVGDDVGMHLLASVAAGEMLKSEHASSPHENLSSCKNNDPETKQLPIGKDSPAVGAETPLSCGNERPVIKHRHIDSSSLGVDRLDLPSPGRNKADNRLAAGCSDIYAEGGRESNKNAKVDRQQLGGLHDTKVNVDSSVSPVDKAEAEVAVIKSQMETEVGCISGMELRKTENNPDHGQMEARPSGKILSAEIDEKEPKADANGLRVTAEFSEMDDVKNNKHNVKSDASTTLKVQTVARPSSGIKEQVESEAVSEEKVDPLASKPQTALLLQDTIIKKSSECEASGKGADEMEEGNSFGETKLEFDLNEGLKADDCKFGEESMNFTNTTTTTTSSSITVPLAVSQLPITTTSSPAAPIAVTAAAAKGPFVPPDDLLRKAKVEIGWKGSAATSAFRPAEPRKQSRPPLDFDLNVADENIDADAALQSSVGLGLDLNCTGEEVSTDGANYSLSNGRNIDVGGAHRGFDLNDEPAVDASEPSTSSAQQQLRNSSMLAHQLPQSGLRLSGSAEVGNFSSWFQPSTSYSPGPVPSVLSDRGEQPLTVVAASRMMGPSAGGIQFNPMLSSSPSPGLPFPSAPFQYSIFPYGPSFALQSATLSGGPTTAYIDPSLGGRIGFAASTNSQLMGPGGAFTSHFPRPHMVSLPDSSGNGSIESSKKWGSRQGGLDLNTGPGVPELEGREEASHLGPRQQLSSVGGVAEEQARRMYQVSSSGLLKRKDPEGGWDAAYRQSSWPQ